MECRLSCNARDRFVRRGSQLVPSQKDLWYTSLTIKTRSRVRHDRHLRKCSLDHVSMTRKIRADSFIYTELSNIEKFERPNIYRGRLKFRTQRYSEVPFRKTRTLKYHVRLPATCKLSVL